MLRPAKEILEAIQNNADFDNADVEKAIINALEILNKDLIFVIYEPGTEIEDAITNMNKVIAAAENEIEEEDDDIDDDDEELLLLDDDDEEDDEDDVLVIEPNEPDEEGTTNEPATT